VSTAQLEELTQNLKNSDPEELQEILDKWLIKNEKATPIVALSRNRRDKDAPATKEELELAEYAYTQRMESARAILEEGFNKEKLDRFYCLMNGNPEFDLRLSQLEKSLKPLIERDRKDMINSFVEGL
jgi:hypothetical protein